MGRKPVRQVQDHTREKPCFRDAKTETNGVELPWVSHQGRAGRDNPPGDQDSANPNPRAYYVKNDVTRNLKQKVSQEKNAGTQSIDTLTEFQFAHHLQFGKAAIHSVEVGDDVADEQNRHDAPSDPAIQRTVRVDRGHIRRSVT